MWPFSVIEDLQAQVAALENALEEEELRSYRLANENRGLKETVLEHVQQIVQLECELAAKGNVIAKHSGKPAKKGKKRV